MTNFNLTQLTKLCRKRVLLERAGQPVPQNMSLRALCDKFHADLDFVMDLLDEVSEPPLDSYAYSPVEGT